VHESCVLTGEDGGAEGDVLVHADGVVERYVAVEKCVSKERDEIATHRHQ